MTRQTVTFFSEGQVIVADTFTPATLEEGRTLPTIIVCHGFTGIRDIPTWHQMGEEFAARGFAVLTFDYRGFGHSGGERGRLAPLDQVEDTRNAITFAETLPFVDASRIGLLGISYGGLIAPHVAALDTRAKATLGLWGVATGYDAVTGTQTPEAVTAWKEKIAEARRRRVLFNENDRTLSALDIFTDAESQQFLGMLRDYVELWRTKFGYDSLARVMEHDPTALVHKIAPRALGLFCGLADKTGDPKSMRRMFDAASEPKKWVEFPGGHYDKWEGEPFQNVLNEAATFFNDHLGRA